MFIMDVRWIESELHEASFCINNNNDNVYLLRKKHVYKAHKYIKSKHVIIQKKNNDYKCI